MRDNTVIPSYFNAENRGSVQPNTNLNNVSLRVGEVKSIVYPEDKLSISKSLVEYSVEVVERNGASTVSSTLYHGCVISQTFGGIGDQFRYTLRADSKTQGQDPKGGVGVGAKVLLLCINGLKSNAVIIGGLADPLDNKHKKEDGHNLFFEFNGIQFEINKDGELKLTFNGKTNQDGSLTDDANEDAQGSYVQINKDGNVKISSPEDDQVIEINHKDSKITIKGNKKIVLDCEKVNLGEEDPSDNLSLASLVKKELKKLKDWQDNFKQGYDQHQHLVMNIQTAGAPTLHNQVAPVPTQAPLVPAPQPQNVDEVKSDTVLSK